MVQWVKVFAVKPVDLRLIPNTQTMKGETNPSSPLISTCCAMFMTTHTERIFKFLFFKGS